jgi:PhoH-like ATPase
MYHKKTPRGHVKNYVLDTSVLVSNPNAIEELKDANIFIPIEVLEELDNLKIRRDHVGIAARQVNRFLDSLRTKGNLLKGVRLQNNQVIRVSTISSIDCLPSGFEDSVDNRIISTAYRMSKKGIEVICLSNDVALRVKCDALGVLAESYKGPKHDNLEFSGIKTINVSKDKVDRLYDTGEVHIEGQELSPNEGVLLRSEASSGLGIADKEGSIKKLRFAGEKCFSVQGVKPRSKEQVIAMELLMNPDVHMVTMTGKAGCGKTLLAVATAIEQLHSNKYRKIVISRPIQSMSKDIGFLPGTKEEKMSPWLQPIFDNMEVIFSKKGTSYFQVMIDKGQIEIEALSHVRGRTLPNTIFIIDEAQNITHHEAKAVLTRMGEDSKIILIGDLEQIDSPTINCSTSGLASVANLFKDFHRAGHVSLIKGERSELATHAAKIM